MPPPKKVKKMEKLKRKGLNVSYPNAPWYTDNEEAILKERSEKIGRINNAQHSEFLKKYPVQRMPGQSLDKVIVEKTDLP